MAACFETTTFARLLAAEQTLMADIIRLLPESIANQIAAGEVVQRPASVVKELMENSIDAGATSIKLIVKDAGKTLIQVIDNGCGMSETDARMSFERHATSKIREAKDLFYIRTMGFRGEAMASIAAVAQVDMRTRQYSEELGTQIIIEGSEVKLQEPCQCTAGTNIQIKNLFFNVPARRQFLKNNAVEMRHVLDEFQRIALANTDVFFSLHHNGTEIFHLPPANLRQRIVGIFGESYNPKLVQVNEGTDEMRVSGFIGKPETSRRLRGEQMFFVNNRFIKSGYLHHALMTTYEEVTEKETHPFYTLFIELDPSHVDINVHPTKQEIKFDDERMVYRFLKSVVRHSLVRYGIAPTLDFEQEAVFSPEQNFGLPFKTSPAEDFEKELSQTVGGSHAMPAEEKTERKDFSSTNKKAVSQNWKELFEAMEEMEDTIASTQPEGAITIESEWSAEGKMDDAGSTFSKQQKEPYQVHASYIVSQIKSGFLLIDQQAAHERILYERYLEALEKRQSYTQKELFPKTINLPHADAILLKEILPYINLVGFDVQEFGKDTYIIHGVPSDLVGGHDEEKIIETLINQYKSNLELNLNVRDSIARSMARSAAIKKGQSLTSQEMQELIDKLFACAMPFKSPSGRSCFLTFELEELEERFKQ